MKILLPLLLFFASFNIAAQPVRDKISALSDGTPYVLKYDKFKDVTTVAFNSEVSKSADSKAWPTNLWLGASFVVTGHEVLADVSDFRIRIGSFCPGWCFLNNHSLILLADGTRIMLGDGVRDSNLVRIGANLIHIENIHYDISRGDIERIAAAKNAEFQVGNYEGVISDGDKAKLKMIISLASKNIAKTVK